MSLATPILRIRKVLRSVGASDAEADEFADALDSYPSRREFELRLEAMFQRQFNRIMFMMIAVTGIAVAIIVAVD